VNGFTSRVQPACCALGHPPLAVTSAPGAELCSRVWIAPALAQADTFSDYRKSFMTGFTSEIHPPPRRDAGPRLGFPDGAGQPQGSSRTDPTSASTKSPDAFTL
jgi:hypothetical protein